MTTEELYGSSAPGGMACYTKPSNLSQRSLPQYLFSLTHFFLVIFSVSVSLPFLSQCNPWGCGSSEAVLQGFLHWHPQATRKDCRLHLRPLLGDQREAWEENWWRLERHDWRGRSLTVCLLSAFSTGGEIRWTLHKTQVQCYHSYQFFGGVILRRCWSIGGCCFFFTCCHIKSRKSSDDKNYFSLGRIYLETHFHNQTAD